MYFVQNVYLCTKIVNIMKKIFTLFALCALTLAANAAYRTYLAGVTEVKIDTLQSTTKNQYTVTIKQIAKNTAEYNKDTIYVATITLNINSDDRTLEGVYSTEFADPNNDSNNVNNQTINMEGSEYSAVDNKGASISRKLKKDEISTFVINKDEEGIYSIGECQLYFSQRLQQVDTWKYLYCYDSEEINTEGISPKPFIFSYSGEYVADVYNYDLTVNDLDIVYNKTDYDAHRYFLTLGCSGKCRETNDERNYEVQLAIYPSEMNIVGSYATQGSGNPLMALYSYVKDLKITKTRYLANDSISSISIVSTGENKYNFTGGPLICTDVDLNHQAVYGKKRIEAVHYYYFNYAGNQGIDFNFDGTTASLIDPVSTGIDNTPFPSGEGWGEALKLFRDGQLIIERNGVFYNMQGAVIR